MYGEEESNNLAREWHSRSHHFYMLWCEAGSDYAYRFTQDDFDSYIPSEEWFDWGTSVDIGNETIWPRITEVNQAFPGYNPGPYPKRGKT